MKIRREVLLKDALFNTSAKSGASEEYGRGLVIGVASALMAVSNIPFSEALEIIHRNLPKDWRDGCFPETWEPSEPRR